MDFTKTTNGDTLTIAPSGILDTASAAAFETEISAVIDEAQNLIIDFSKVEYISSSGLRVLLKAQKKKSGNGSMTLTHVNECVMEVFNLTGFNDILKIS